MAAVQASGLNILQVWWDIPAAIAYQLALSYWQTQGSELVVDNREEIRQALCQTEMDRTES